MAAKIIETRRVDFHELELPHVLYKYRGWTGFPNHQQILFNSEIFLSSPRHFNDPFDCRIPIAYFLLESDPGLRKKYFPEFVKRNFPHYSEQQIVRLARELEEEGRYMDFKWMREQDKSYFEEFFNRWGVFSMSTKPFDSLMWAHYANNHKGVCLGFDPKKLFVDDKKIGGGGKITYLNAFPHIRPDEDFMAQSLTQLYTKSNLWSYEDEYRVDKLGGADSKVEYDGKALVEIYFGINMNPGEKNEAFLAARELNKKVLAFEIFAEDHSYNLNCHKFQP